MSKLLVRHGDTGFEEVDEYIDGQYVYKVHVDNGRLVVLRKFTNYMQVDNSFSPIAGYNTWYSYRFIDD